jgi:hypothetical protein
MYNKIGFLYKGKDIKQENILKNKLIILDDNYEAMIENENIETIDQNNSTSSNQSSPIITPQKYKFDEQKEKIHFYILIGFLSLILVPAWVYYAHQMYKNYKDSEYVSYEYPFSPSEYNLLPDYSPR